MDTSDIKRANEVAHRAAWSSRPPAPEQRAGDDAIDVSEIWTTLLNNKRTIATFTVLVFALVVAVTALSRMSFTSTGRLYLGELDRNAGATSGEVDLSGGGQGDVGSEVEILKSRSQVARAVLASGLNARILPSGSSSPRLWQWLLSRRSPSLLDTGLKVVRVSNAQLAEQVRRPRKYLVRFTDLQHYEVWQEERKVGTGTLEEPAELGELSITLHRGTRGAPQEGARFDLEVTPLEDAIAEAQSALVVSAPKVTPGADTPKVVTLEYVDSSPTLASRFLRALMDGYLAERQEWKTEDATAAERFVAEQLGVIRGSLDSMEQRLADYRTNNRVVVLDNEAKAMIEQVGKYEEQRVAARLQVAALADMKRALKSPNARMEAFLLGEAHDSVLEGLASNLTTARQELASLEQRFSPAAPDVRNQRAQVDAQLEVIRNYVGTRHARAQENLGSLNHIINQFEEKLKTVPGAELGLAQLARESEVYSKMYSYLLERQQQAAMIKASTVSKNRILDFPEPPHRESSPQLPLRIAGGFLGLFVGVLYVLLRHSLSATLQSESDVRRLAGATPVYARLQVAPAQKRSSGRWNGLAYLREHPDSPFAESLRSLRASLERQLGDASGKCILVSSPTSGDGKTSLALSLAPILAVNQRSVLVIDGDLRKPSHHELLGVSREPGLSEVLAERCDWPRTIRPILTMAGEVFVMTAGQGELLDAFSGPRFGELVAQLRSRFDFIIVDTAAFPQVADAHYVARHADCTLSVVRLGYTRKRAASEHVVQLDMAGKLHGIVVASEQAAASYTGYRRPDRRADAALLTDAHAR